MNDYISYIVNGKEMGVKFDVWLKGHKDLPNISCKTYEEDYQDKYKHIIFYERNFYPNLQTIANDLYEKGLIEKGEYVIEINW